MILDLAKPLTQLNSKIDNNCSYLEIQKTKLKEAQNERTELSMKMYIEVENVATQSLRIPDIVCTAEQCIDVVKFKGQPKIHYKTRCHQSCQDVNVTGLEMVGKFNKKVAG